MAETTKSTLRRLQPGHVLGAYGFFLLCCYCHRSIPIGKSDLQLEPIDGHADVPNWECCLLIEIKLTKIVFEVLMNPRPMCRYCSTQTDFKPVP